MVRATPAFHIFEFTPETIAAWCEAGMPAFRGRQVLEWVYTKGVADPELMTNLSKRDRGVVAAEMTLCRATRWRIARRAMGRGSC